MIENLCKLADKGQVFLKLVGTGWPDITGYLEGKYLRNSQLYRSRVEEAVNFLRRSIFVLVSIPEPIPVSQTFQVAEIIRGFGAQAYMCVVNKLCGRGWEGPNIDRLQQHGLPLVRVAQNSSFLSEEMSPEDRQDALAAIGQEILAALPV